jgi:hypothetical protein
MVDVDVVDGSGHGGSFIISPAWRGGGSGREEGARHSEMASSRMN